MIKKYVKKPVVIEAILYDSNENLFNIIKFCNGNCYQDNGELYIRTLEGDMRADLGSYIIKGIKGEFYACRGDIFKETYKEVDGTTNNESCITEHFISSESLFSGHGKLKCRSCGKVIMSCRCFQCNDVTYTICGDCKS